MGSPQGLPQDLHWAAVGRGEDELSVCVLGDRLRESSYLTGFLLRQWQGSRSRERQSRVGNPLGQEGRLGRFEVPVEIQEAVGSVCAESAKGPSWKKHSRVKALPSDALLNGPTPCPVARRAAMYLERQG